MAQLEPCTSCGRHVRVSSNECPFCGTALALRAPARPALPVGLSRAAIFALGTALTTATGACYASHEPGDDAAVTDAAVSTPDLGHDTGCECTAVLYGLAPFDAGPRREPSAADAGTPLAMYGGPPRP